jgi:hypothetical protein
VDGPGSGKPYLVSQSASFSATGKRRQSRPKPFGSWTARTANFSAGRSTTLRIGANVPGSPSSSVTRAIPDRSQREHSAVRAGAPGATGVVDWLRNILSETGIERAVAPEVSSLTVWRTVTSEDPDRHLVRVSG